MTRRRFCVGCDGALGSDEALSSTSVSDLELSAGEAISDIGQSPTVNAAKSSSDNSVPMMRAAVAGYVWRRRQLVWRRIETHGSCRRTGSVYESMRRGGSNARRSRRCVTKDKRDDLSVAARRHGENSVVRQREPLERSTTGQGPLLRGERRGRRSGVAKPEAAHIPIAATSGRLGHQHRATDVDGRIWITATRRTCWRE